MAKFEHWADAYQRMLNEVKAEHPDWDEPTVYREYRVRTAQWKVERGIKLNAGDVKALATVEPAEFCLICQATGPVNFVCPHPDAHTPLANSQHDANGEPWEDEDSEPVLALTQGSSAVEPKP